MCVSREHIEEIEAGQDPLTLQPSLCRRALTMHPYSIFMGVDLRRFVESEEQDWTFKLDLICPLQLIPPGPAALFRVEDRYMCRLRTMEDGSRLISSKEESILHTNYLTFNKFFRNSGL